MNERTIVSVRRGHAHGRSTGGVLVWTLANGEDVRAGETLQDEYNRVLKSAYGREGAWVVCSLTYPVIVEGDVHNVSLHAE